MPNFQTYNRHTIDLIALCDAAEEAFNKNVPIEAGKIPKSAASLSNDDIRIIDGNKLAKLLVTIPSEVPFFISGGIRAQILDQNPTTAFYLSKMVVEDTHGDEALNCLLDHARYEAAQTGQSLARRTLAGLYLSKIINEDSIGPELIGHIKPYKQSLELLLKTEPFNSKCTPIELLLSEDLDNEYLQHQIESISSDSNMLRTAVRTIHSILTDPKSDVVSKVVAFDRLLLLHEELRNNLYDNPEDALMVILSTPGLLEDLYEELMLADQFSGGQTARWIRAGLNNSYFREDVIGVFTYVAAFSHDGSALRAELFNSILANEVSIEELSQNAERKYGINILPRFESEYKNFLNNDLSHNAPCLINLVPSDERTILWVFKPSEERILLDGYNASLERIGVKATIGYERIKGRLLTALREKEDEDFRMWFGLNYPNSIEYNISTIKKYYIINEVVKASLPRTSLSPKYKKLRNDIAWIASSDLYNESAKSILELLIHVHNNKTASTFVTLKLLDWYTYSKRHKDKDPNDTTLDRALALTDNIREHESDNLRYRDYEPRNSRISGPYKGLTFNCTRVASDISFNPDFPAVGLLHSDSGHVHEYILDIRTGKLISCPDGTIEAYKKPEYGSDGQAYCDIKISGQWYIFDQKNKKIIKTNYGVIQACGPTVFGPNGEALKRVRINDTWKLLNLKTGKIIKTNWPEEANFDTPQFDASGVGFVLCNKRGEYQSLAVVINLTTGETVKDGNKEILVHESPVKNPNGDLYVISNYPSACLFNLSKDQREKSLPTNLGLLHKLCFTKQGRAYARKHSGQLLDLTELTPLRTEIGTVDFAGVIHSVDGFPAYVETKIDDRKCIVDLESKHTYYQDDLTSCNIKNSLPYLVDCALSTTVELNNPHRRKSIPAYFIKNMKDMQQFSIKYIILSNSSTYEYLIMTSRSLKEGYFFYDIKEDKFSSLPSGWHFSEHTFLDQEGNIICLMHNDAGSSSLYKLTKEVFAINPDKGLRELSIPYYTPFGVGYCKGLIKGKPGYYNINTDTFVALKDPEAICTDIIKTSPTGKTYAVVEKNDGERSFTIVDVDSGEAIVPYTKYPSLFPTSKHPIELVFSSNGEGFAKTGYVPYTKGLICFAPLI